MKNISPLTDSRNDDKDRRVTSSKTNLLTEKCSYCNEEFETEEELLEHEWWYLTNDS